MAYGTNKSTYGGNNRTNSNARATTAAAAGTTGEREEPVFQKLITLKTSGKGNLTFTVGKDGMTVPANTRLAIVPLTEKRLGALQAAAAKKGYESKVTHEIVGFPITFDK
jgi:hypothetical protein